MVNITVFVCSWLLITLQTSKSIDVTTFITFFTILLLYRERVTSAVSELHEYVDFSGRLKHTSKKFREMTGDFNKMTEMVEKTYPTIETAFDTIVFDKVSFKYNKTNRWIFENLNLNLNLNNNIIGVVGKSGKGKSSFVKLLLRLYDCTEGTIYLDGRDITQIDPDYIRSNITYVNQTGKLFDKNVVENMLYGCNNLDKCNSALQEVFQYDKIRALFQNIDLTSTSAGSLGENLSGGQRQIVNIISGLIHPSKILILDEPTNALDPEIKKQLLAILAKFKEYKKSIIIITHDKDVYSLFDQTLKL
jgi:ABC-type multidrug transport system fused ATPase/permease subunit